VRGAFSFMPYVRVSTIASVVRRAKCRWRTWC
jgi:hypothetical protein